MLKGKWDVIPLNVRFYVAEALIEKYLFAYNFFFIETCLIEFSTF